MCKSAFMAQTPKWQVRALTVSPVALCPGQLHLYALHTDEVPDVKHLYASLSKDEQKRANAYVHCKDQHRFVLARGVLRHLVGQYLGIDSAMVVFRYGVAGKPYIDRAATPGAKGGLKDLYVNVSHSGGWVLYALSQGIECGVDIERINHENNHLGISERFFHATEQAYLQALHVTQQAAAFYAIWVMKEALAKSTGQSLFDCLGIAVPTPCKPDHYLYIEKQSGQSIAQYIDIFEGYAAAWCCASTDPLAVSTWQLEVRLETEKT
jgi:4'-phosphopantetheinyl transferase